MSNTEQKQTVAMPIELLNKILGIIAQLPYQNVFQVMDEIRALGAVAQVPNQPEEKEEK